MKFEVIVQNSEKIIIDKIEVDSRSCISALLEAEKVFLSKNTELELLDSGMFIGSYGRDLTVENKNNSGEEYYQLKLIEPSLK